MFHLSHPLRCRGGREGTAGEQRGDAGRVRPSGCAGWCSGGAREWVPISAHSGVSIVPGERQLGARGSTIFLPELPTSQFVLGEFGSEKRGFWPKETFGFPEQLIPTIYVPLQLESIPVS